MGRTRDCPAQVYRPARSTTALLVVGSFLSDRLGELLQARLKHGASRLRRVENRATGMGAPFRGAEIERANTGGVVGRRGDLIYPRLFAFSPSG